MTESEFIHWANEFKRLSDQIKEIREFISNEEEFNKLDAINRDILIAQFNCMQSYLSTLSIRLSLNGSMMNKETAQKLQEQMDESKDAEYNGNVDSIEGD